MTSQKEKGLRNRGKAMLVYTPNLPQQRTQLLGLADTEIIPFYPSNPLTVTLHSLNFTELRTYKFLSQ